MILILSFFAPFFWYNMVQQMAGDGKNPSDVHPENARSEPVHVWQTMFVSLKNQRLMHVSCIC
jgi:uncharacterized protein YvpB